MVWAPVYGTPLLPLSLQAAFERGAFNPGDHRDYSAHAVEASACRRDRLPRVAEVNDARPYDLFFILIVAGMLCAHGTYTQTDYPGARQTVLLGTNTVGDVVGEYQDFNLIYHGFLLSGGVFTTIDNAERSVSCVTAINDVGQLAGVYNEFPVGGFVYDLQTQTFTDVSYGEI